RRGKLISVDKANVLETSRLWRQVVTDLGPEYADVELRHGLVDSVAMWLVMHPGEFDVLVMENTFGDILSDVAAGVTGGLGLAASASLGDSGPGIFEPVHGSAPDLAGAGRELHRGRLSRRRRRGDARRTPDRELAARAGRGDPRPALRGAALHRQRGDASDRPLPGCEGADPAFRGANAALELGRVRP